MHFSHILARLGRVRLVRSLIFSPPDSPELCQKVDYKREHLRAPRSKSSVLSLNHFRRKSGACMPMNFGQRSGSASRPRLQPGLIALQSSPNSFPSIYFASIAQLAVRCPSKIRQFELMAGKGPWFKSVWRQISYLFGRVN